MAGILVIAESTGAGLTPASLELVSAARQLAAQGAGPITAFVAGNEALAQQLIAAGADSAIAGTNAALAGATADVFLPAVEAALAQSGAEIVLIAQSSLGRDLGPMLAFAHNTGVAMDCTELKIDGGKLRATRSAYGGNARAEHTWTASPAIVTLKAKSYDPAEGPAGSGSVSTTDAAAESKIKVLGVSKAESTGIKLEDAAVVVSGGRGLGDGSAFKMLEDLAGTMQLAAVGASRAACDLGWYPPALQVGLTGKTVSPNLYIAIAISGASQHMAGMAGSKNIIAINKDADANMVKVSKFAIIDDYKKVVPALIEEIKKLA